MGVHEGQVDALGDGIPQQAFQQLLDLLGAGLVLLGLAEDGHGPAAQAAGFAAAPREGVP